MTQLQDHSQGSPEADPISDFKEFLEKSEIQSQITPKESFVCITAVKIYLGQHACLKLKAILDVLYPKDDNTHRCKEILDDCTAVLCTLIKINKGRHIKSFTETLTLNDGHLPFDPSTKPKNFPKDSDANFYVEFCKRQWMFVAVPFTENMGKNLESPNRLIPITEMGEPAWGGSGSVSRIEIHGCYNLLHGKKRHDSPCASNKLLDTFALKTYYESGSESSKWEVEAYEKLKNGPNITEYYGNFKHNNTNYVIMEYADRGSLEGYLKTTAPPSKPEDIMAFWRSMFDITKALYHVHTHEIRVGGHSEIEVGWHYDLKPENILVFGDSREGSDYKPHFKLTDFGLSLFMKRHGKSEEPLAVEGGGTVAYGAPECSKHDKDWEDMAILATRHADIWSFACILSEAIVWMGMNYDGLQEYRGARMAHNSKSHYPKLGDCFHNGTTLLDLVPEWHTKAKQSLRATDHITAKVVEIIEGRVFRKVSPQLRSDAKQFSLELDMALNEAQESINGVSNSRRSPDAHLTPREDPARQQVSLPGRAKAEQIIEDFATLLKEADENLKHDEAATASDKFVEALQIWKNKFSSVSDQLLGHEIIIYRGLNKALIEKGKSFEGKKEKKENRLNAKYFEEQADITQRFLDLKRKK